MRQGIVGSEGTPSQREFNFILEQAVAKEYEEDLVARYQDILKNARSRLDYVVGFPLYMMPSDMRLSLSGINN